MKHTSVDVQDVSIFLCRKGRGRIRRYPVAEQRIFATEFPIRVGLREHVVVLVRHALPRVRGNGQTGYIEQFTFEAAMTEMDRSVADGEAVSSDGVCVEWNGLKMNVAAVAGSQAGFNGASYECFVTTKQARWTGNAHRPANDS